jgi:glucokinase
MAAQTVSDFAIAVDLGGTQLRAALVDRGGVVSARQNVATAAQAGADTVVKQISDLVKTVISEATGKKILGVGVSSPGPLDTAEGIALSLPTIAGFENFPLGAALRKSVALPLWLENDGIAAAIGEWRLGAGRGFANIVYVTVSTGIGGGVIVDNHVMRGRRGMAGHVGHMIIVPDGDVCGCGTRGCFEAYGAGPAFTKRAVSRGLTADSKAVFEAAREGHAIAMELVREEAEILGRGFASLAHLYSPDLIVMGGGLANAFDDLIPDMRATFIENAMPAFKDIKIVRAGLGGNSGLIGAAALVFDGTQGSA